MRPVTRPERAVRGLVVALCLYEISAVLSARHPTLSTILSTRPWLERQLVRALSIHLQQMREQALTQEAT